MEIVSFQSSIPLTARSSWSGTTALTQLKKQQVIQVKQARRKVRLAHPIRIKPSCTVNRGFSGFLSNSSGMNPRNTLPNPESLCSCGSDKPYGKCCRRFHTAQSFPPLAEDLLRSRYTAYAYRLPSYIMKTTHSSLAELDRRKWKREILNFCSEYQFLGGIDIIEQQMTGPNTTRILFRYVL